jgi:hypothetical protein
MKPASNCPSKSALAKINQIFKDESSRKYAEGVLSRKQWRVVTNKTLRPLRA